MFDSLSIRDLTSANRVFVCWGILQSIELARGLKPLGVDLIDCSSGGNVARANIPVGPGYQTRFAGRIRDEADIMVQRP